MMGGSSAAAPTRAPHYIDPLARTALEALLRRLEHVEAIVSLLARPSDTELGTAMRGVAELLSDTADRLDKIVNPTFREGC